MINDCPPNPGLTLITSIKSSFSNKNSNPERDVPGFIETPALHPKSLILVKVLSRCGVTSLWTVIISTPAATYSSNKSSGLATIKWASNGFLEIFLIDLIIGGPNVRFGTK